MQKTNVHDVRGRLSLLGRLLEFDREAFVHLLFYRALIISSLITVVIFAASLLFSSLDYAWEIMIAIDWLFFTTQVFETSKGLSLTGSNGAAFGRLNPSFVSSMLPSSHTSFYRSIPYVLLAIWLVGLGVYIGVVLI